MTEPPIPLLPCPFCGSSDIDAEGWANNEGARGPACNSCNASAGMISKSHADNIAAWNTRAHPTPDSSVKAGPPWDMLESGTYVWDAEKRTLTTTVIAPGATATVGIDHATPDLEKAISEAVDRGYRSGFDAGYQLRMAEEVGRQHCGSESEAGWQTTDHPSACCPKCGNYWQQCRCEIPDNFTPKGAVPEIGLNDPEALEALQQPDEAPQIGDLLEISSGDGPHNKGYSLFREQMYEGGQVISGTQWLARIRENGWHIRIVERDGKALRSNEREFKKPTEAMCHTARGFIVGLDLNHRTWGAMQKHLEAGGYPTLYFIKDKANKDPKGHITKWDVADCIYRLMEGIGLYPDVPEQARKS